MMSLTLESQLLMLTSMLMSPQVRLRLLGDVADDEVSANWLLNSKRSLLLFLLLSLL